MQKRGRELDAESLGTKISSPSKSERAYEIVSRVRKLLSTVDEELPTLHHLLSDVDFLAKPSVARSAVKAHHGVDSRDGQASQVATTPPIVRKSQEVLRSVMNFKQKALLRIAFALHLSGIKTMRVQDKQARHF